METGDMVRLRLVFEDRKILSKSQKKEGLKRSWILLQPQHRTIFDFSAHLLHIFDLRDSCPFGLILSMDGFVLPYFESTCILTDKDVVSVKRKGGILTEITESDGLNSLEEIEIVENQPFLPGVNLLANEEFDKETGGYESESEEDELESLEDVLYVEDTQKDNKVSKKRKASNKIQSSKRKKSKVVDVEEHQHAQNTALDEDVGSGGHKIPSKKNKVKKGKTLDQLKEPEKTSIPDSDERNDNISKPIPSAERSYQIEGNGQQNGDVTQTPGETKKVPSRSARRKKAKRQWLREQAKREQRELTNLLSHENQLLGKDNQQSSGNNNHKFSEEHEPADQLNDLEDDVDDDVVPVEVRPGHIRFGSSNKVGGDKALVKSEVPVETFQWHGVTTKKKGQKWGTERTASSKKNNGQASSQECSRVLAVEVETSANGCLDYDKLALYSSLPKEGDVIAYRVIELSLSWTPEISSFRVGKISLYNAKSNKIILVPVPEYPLEKKVDEETSTLDASLYKEDGTLEIDFSSLLDTRIVKHGSSSVAKMVIDKDTDACVPPSVATTSRPENNNEGHSPTQVNGQINAWEEISQALSAKKAQLSQEDSWRKEESPGKKSWSYKGLRGSALGPTMALLRAQNDL